MPSATPFAHLPSLAALEGKPLPQTPPATYSAYVPPHPQPQAQRPAATYSLWPQPQPQPQAPPAVYSARTPQRFTSNASHGTTRTHGTALTAGTMRLRNPFSGRATTDAHADAHGPGLLSHGLSTHAIHAFRLLQFVLGLTAAGLYGHALHSYLTTHPHTRPDAKLSFALVCAGLSCVTAALLCVPVLKRARGLWAWEWVLFVFWVGVFGAYGRVYLGAETGGVASVQRMKNAVWVDLTCLLMWFVSAGLGAVTALVGGRKKKVVGPSEV